MLRSIQMPTYDFRCPNGHTFELFQRMSDPPPDGCDVCGATPVERLLSPVAVHFKGSGFYSTDYGRGTKTKDADTSSTTTDKPKEPAEKKPAPAADASS
jgi:putative FmdB family regulatory protein